MRHTQFTVLGVHLGVATSLPLFILCKGKDLYRRMVQQVHSEVNIKHLCIVVHPVFFQPVAHLIGIVPVLLFYRWSPLVPEPCHVSFVFHQMHVMHLLQRLDEGHLHHLKVPGRQSSSGNQRQTDQ